MRVVVADTTPIRYLTEISRLDLLPRLFETVFIPSIVYEELQSPSTPQSVRTALQPPPEWLKVVPAATVDDDPVLLTLDEGEKAALSLGLSLHADLILIDERKAAAVAQQKGLAFTGTLGILILSAKRNLLHLPDAFDSLRRTNFHCSESLMQKLLSQYQEM